ncbi:hypothetical protein HA402_009524 [Bradysia odoriphaga]|nr:hypothetical protein HA402_009524 [Bradysia odoriphaga]
MCSPDDDFFYVLDKSLRNEYSSQKMSNFIADLLVAINNLDDDPDEGFGFYDDETDCWNGFDSFTVPSSNDYSESHQIDFRTGNFKEREDHNSSVDMFDDEPSQDPVSNGGANITVVDLVDNEPLRKTEARAHEMNVEFDKEAPQAQSLPVADIALILEDESRDSSIDMFAEFETDVEVMDTSVSLDDINTTKQSGVTDRQNKDAEDSQCVRRSDNEQHGVEPLKNQSETIVSHSLALRKSFTLPHDHQDEQPLPVNEHMGTEGHTTPKLLSQQNIESSEGATDGNVENEAGYSVAILLGVPINISYCEGNEGENTEMQVSQMSSRMVQRSLSVATKFPGIVCAKENLSQEGSRRTLRAVDERPDTSMRSSCQSSPFRGFSPVAPLLQQSSSCASTKLDSDSNTTLCEEYEYSNNLMPISPRSSPIFRGFSDETALTHTSQYHNSIATAISQTSDHHNSIRSSSRSEGGPNSTFCEEYESERLFAAYLNATQGDQINLEEAYTQCFSESQNPVSHRGTRDRRQSFIEEIEKLVLKIGNDLMNGRKLAITVPYRVSWNNCFVNEERLLLRPLSNGGTRTIASKRRIALIVSVLSFVHKLLINNETCTRREIYYSDPEFTHSQIQVDTAIMDICFILNAPPWEIGILSSSKGLIAGSIKLTLKDDTVLDVESVDGGILLPQQTMSIKKVETVARFVLLVEKHTVYEKLLLENVLNRLGPCILVTGKGYPDINTRVILKKIWDDCKCPIYALVDADPHGIEIMLSYRHGSQKMSYFNDNLAIPSIRWIGVFPSEIKKFNLLSLPMTPQDVNRLDSLMKRPYMSTKIYKELLVLKRTQKKSEVEALLSSTVVDCIHSHLLHKIQNGGFI